MSDELTEHEKFFKEKGYRPNRFVPRKQIFRQVAVDNSNQENHCGLVVSSLTAGTFDNPDGEWANRIHRPDKIVYASHHEAIRAGKLTCKYGCQS